MPKPHRPALFLLVGAICLALAATLAVVTPADGAPRSAPTPTGDVSLNCPAGVAAVTFRNVPVGSTAVIYTGDDLAPEASLSGVQGVVTLSARIPAEGFKAVRVAVRHPAKTGYSRTMPATCATP